MALPEGKELLARLERYAAERMDGDDVRVDGLERILGGASRETYRFVLHWHEAGRDRRRRLILRRDPPGSLIETDRRVEFAAYKAFHGSAVPVPEALWLEADETTLGSPFFVMEEIAGFEASPMKLIEPPYYQNRSRMGERKWTILGEISKADPQRLGLTDVLEPVEPDQCWRRELDRWERVIDEDELEPQPIIRAAIRRLRAEPPPSAQRVSVVHADFRTGNFLFDGEGEIHAILDWEMMHLGDPLEDLAWGVNRVWNWTRDGLAGGLLPKHDAVALWERASGLRAPAEALRWWELFSCVKGQAIWISAAREYQDGSSRQPIMAVPYWMQGNSQDRAALELMGHLT